MSNHPATIEPGEIVTARVIDWTVIEERHQRPDGKARPVVLVEKAYPDRPNHPLWRVMGLTTLSHHIDGEARIPTPPSTTRVQSYLWSGRLAMVEAKAIHEHIGWATDELVDAIIQLTGRSAWDLEPMRPHAQQDRRRRAAGRGK